MTHSACFAVSTPVPYQSLLRGSPLVSRCPRVRPPCAAQVSSYSSAANLTLNAVSGDDAPKIDEGKRSRLTTLRKQIEFWFSSANLKRDWYLRRQMNEEGWLDPSVFLKFNLTKRLNASLSDIVAACGESDILEVSSPSNAFGDQLQQTRVRRASGSLQNLDEEEDDESARSIIAESIPLDSTCESIREIFSRYGHVTYVWLPRKSGGDAVRGYALISYESPGLATKAISEFQRDQEKGDMPKDISVKSKVEWELSFKHRKMDSKVLFVKNIPAPCNWRMLWGCISRRFTQEGIPLLYLSYRNDDNHCFLTLRNQEDADMALQYIFNDLDVRGHLLSASILTDPDMLSKYWASAAEKMSQRRQRSMEEKSTEGDSISPFPRNVIVKIDGLPDGLHWKYVLDALKSWGNVVFLRYSARTGDCYVRFSSWEIASVAAAGITGSYMCEYKVTAEVLTGQEEEAYWTNFKESKKRRERQSQLSLESTNGSGDPSRAVTQEKPLSAPGYVPPVDTKLTEAWRDAKSEILEEDAASKLAGAGTALEEQLSPKPTDRGDDLSGPEAQGRPLSSPGDANILDAAKQYETSNGGESAISEEVATSKLAGAETTLEEELAEEPESSKFDLSVEETADLGNEEVLPNSEMSSESTTVSQTVQTLETPASTFAGEEKLVEEPQNTDLSLDVEEAAGLKNEEIRLDTEVSSESTTLQENAEDLETPASSFGSIETSREGKLDEEPEETNLSLEAGKTAGLRYEGSLPNSEIPSESTAVRENAQVLFMQETREEQDSTNGLSSLGRTETTSASADQEPAATSGSHL